MRRPLPLAVVLALLAAPLAAGPGGRGAPAPAFVRVEPAAGLLVLANEGDGGLRLRGAVLRFADDAPPPVVLASLSVPAGGQVALPAPGPLPAPGGVRLTDADGFPLAAVAWPALPAGAAAWSRFPGDAWHAAPDAGDPAPPPAVVNEIDPAGDRIEVHVPGPDPVSLAGFTLAGHVFPPGHSLAGGAFETVAAALPDGGGEVVLRDGSGLPRDGVAYPALAGGETYGRVRDAAAGWVVFSTPSFGKANKKGTLRGLSEPSHAKGAPDYDYLFDEHAVRRLDLTVPPAGLDALARYLATRFRQDDPRSSLPYVEGTVALEGREWRHVGIRYKGHSSLTPFYEGRQKLPLKLDFDEFEDTYPETKDQRFFGLKQISFANAWRDPSLLRDFLTLEILRGTGAPVSRAAFWRVFVNGTYHGLYTVVEEVDEAFVLDRFGSDSGNLYKPDGPAAALTRFAERDFEKETNEDAADFSDVKALVAALQDREEDIGEHVDVDDLLRWLAVTVAVANRDSYLSRPHNYFLYADPALGRFRFVSWDHNLTFGAFAPGHYSSARRHALPPDRPWTGRRPLAARLLEVPEHRDRYFALLRDLLAGPLAKETFDARARSLQDRIRPYVVGPEGEVFPHTLLARPEDFDAALDSAVSAGGPDLAPGLIPFLDARRSFLEAVLR